MKSIWSGTLAFGLVQIPIKLLSAIQSQRFGFRMLHAQCNSPLSYERRCGHCGKVVAWEDTVKGLEADDGTFFVFTQEKLEELKPERTDSIDIVAFVERDLIPDIYLENHYYVVPDKKGNKPFFLFHRALEDSGLVAIGSFVMREKQYVCAIEPYENGLLLTTLNYEYEIRPLENIPALEKVPKLSKDEVALAKKLIGQMTKKRFDITKFKDTFVEQLKKAIKTKRRSKPKATPKAKPKAPAKRKKDDLITTLRGSLRAPARTRTPAYAKRTKTVRKKAASKKAVRKRS